MSSWASVVSGVVENEGGFNDFFHPFNADGFSADFAKPPQKRQPRNTKNRSSKRRKRKNKGQDYNLENFEYSKEFDILKFALDFVNDDNGRVMKENEKLLDQLKKADVEIAYYMQKSEQLKFELDAAVQDKMAASEELKKTKNMLKHKEIVEDFFDCLICMEPCVASSDHNTCSLPCGHFFGRSCVEQWISAKKISKCPVCQKSASLGGIRIH